MSSRGGYIGKPEDVKQVTSERGLFVEGISTVTHALLLLNLEIISEQPDFKTNLWAEALSRKVSSLSCYSPGNHPIVTGVSVGTKYLCTLPKMEFQKVMNEILANFPRKKVIWIRARS